MPASVSYEMRTTQVLGKLKAFGQRVEDKVLAALDLIAAEVSNSAKHGHPKVHDSIQGAEADLSREMNTHGVEEGGSPAGYRFLTRTKLLVNNIFIERASRLGVTLAARVYSGVEYAPHVEYGTTKARAFPFMRPALVGAIPRGRERIKRAITDAASGL